MGSMTRARKTAAIIVNVQSRAKKCNITAAIRHYQFEPNRTENDRTEKNNKSFQNQKSKTLPTAIDKQQVLLFRFISTSLG